ncbi:helix-turn-helix domain-containing protein [Herbaspirillum huttiense]|uniref:helix-turn-helix domain-containing protein n=1 Tax=Herbaspirillum huttiense TaxID=863372 RepID=UPI0039AF54A5
MPRASVKVDYENALPALGSTIRTLRKERGFSQEELADRSEIDRSHMGKIERGERNVSVVNLLRIANALDIRLAIIIEKTGL